MYQVQVQQEHQMHQVQVQQEHHPDNGSNNSEEVEHIEYDSDFKILDCMRVTPTKASAEPDEGGSVPMRLPFSSRSYFDAYSDKQRRETLSFFSLSFLQFHILKLLVLY